METSPISEHLHDLLLQYDCVIVPEMGGFVTEYRSARIDTQRHIIYPPSKDLRFNTQLKQNDGLLANAIARSTSLSHEAANEMIKSSVEQYFTQLEEGKAVEFDRVGILYLDSAKNIRFKADSEVNLLLDSFRLKTIYAQPSAAEVKVVELKEEVAAAPAVKAEPAVAIIPPLAPVTETSKVAISQAEEPKAETEDEVPVVPIQSSSRKRRWIAAALIPLLFYIGYVGLRSDVVNDGTIMVSDLNPFGPTPPAASYTPRGEATSIEIEAIEAPAATKLESISTKDAYVETEEPCIEPDEVSIPEEAELTAAPVSTYVEKVSLNAGSFHIIGGCFSERSNAERLVSTLQAKGFPAHILDTHKGLHRVAYGTYVQREEALEVLQAVKEEEQSGAWLLRKK